MNDDQLEDAVRQAFRDAVMDVEPSRELRDRVDGIRRRRFRRGAAWSRIHGRLVVATAGGLSAATVAVLAGIAAFTGATAPPAFAVVVSKGTLSITMHSVESVAAVDARLRRLHVPFVVVPMTRDCKSHFGMTYLAAGRGGPIHLHPGGVRPGRTIVLAARQIKPGVVDFGAGWTDGKVPSCVPVGHSGPGLGPFEMEKWNPKLHRYVKHWVK